MDEQKGSCQRCATYIKAKSQAVPRRAPPDRFEELRKALSEESRKQKDRLMERLEVLTDMNSKLGTLDLKVGSLVAKVDSLSTNYNALKEDVEILSANQVKLREDFERDKTERRKETEGSQTIAVANCLKELTERADKQRKLVVFGVPESGENSVKKKLEADRAFVASLLQLLSPDFVNIRYFVSKIGDVVGAEKVPRPLTVCVESPDQANFIIKLFISQKKTTTFPPLLRNLNVSADKTKLQREEYALAKAQLEGRKAMGKEDLMIVTRSGAPVVQTRKNTKTNRHAGPSQ